MKITAADEARATTLISHDVEVTLGGGHEELIRGQASRRRRFCNDPETIDVSTDEYLENVAEEIQQYFHDCFVDTVWPACPFHQRHPLWLHAGMWTCEQLSAGVARLGELRATHDSFAGYRIVVDRDRTPRADAPDG